MGASVAVVRMMQWHHVELLQPPLLIGNEMCYWQKGYHWVFGDWSNHGYEQSEKSSVYDILLFVQFTQIKVTMTLFYIEMQIIKKGQFHKKINESVCQ